MNNKVLVKNSKKAFTLVELVVVVAILAILAAIAIPVVSSTITASQRSRALSEAQTLELALKEADAMIKAGDKSIYPNGVNTTVGEVVNAKSLQSIGLSTSNHKRKIGNATFNFKWDPIDDKCYFICSTPGDGYIGGNLLDKNVTASSTVASMKFITTNLKMSDLF